MNKKSASSLELFPARLREIRVQQGIGVRQLAKYANLTPALISFVEHGKVKPSVNSLYAIAKALGVSVSELFVAPTNEKHPYVVQYSSDRFFSSLKMGKLEYEDAPAIGKGFGFREISPSILRMSKRNFTPQQESLRGDQLLYCISGKIDYICDDQTFRLSPGDSLFFDSHIPHGPHAMRSAKAEYLLCYVDELYGWLDMRLDFRNSLQRPPKAPAGMTPAQRIAWRVRYVRNKRGYHQAEVRALTGLSHGMLSHIESGRAVPSLVTIETIANVMDIPMSYFFDDDSDVQKICFIKATERVMEKRNENKHHYLACRLANDKFGMPLFTPEIREYSRRGFVPEQSEQRGQFFSIVLSGEIEYRCGEDNFRLGEGDSVYSYSDINHGVQRVISAKAEILYCHSNLSKYLIRMLRPWHSQ